MLAITANEFVLLAGDFPPTLNKESHPTQLEVNESPDAYGIAWDSQGRLRTGTVPSGTAYSVPTKTISTVTYYWIYNRLWRYSGSTLYYGAPHYDDLYLAQNVGRLACDATIITILPVLGESLMVCTASGSLIIRNANDPRAFMFQTHWYSALDVAAAANVALLGNVPFVSSASGVLSFDGNEIKEWTAKVRNTLGSFTTANLGVDYEKKLVIGGTSFAIDAAREKLFDYGTAGFRFTTRTLAQPAMLRPFRTTSISIGVQHGSAAGGTIKWESQIDDNDWYAEPDIEVPYNEETYSRIQRAVENPVRTGMRFRIRLTSLSSNLYLTDIFACTDGLAMEAHKQ